MELGVLVWFEGEGQHRGINGICGVSVIWGNVLKRAWHKPQSGDHPVRISQRD